MMKFQKQLVPDKPAVCLDMVAFARLVSGDVCVYEGAQVFMKDIGFDQMLDVIRKVKEKKDGR